MRNILILPLLLLLPILTSAQAVTSKFIPLSYEELILQARMKQNAASRAELSVSQEPKHNLGITLQQLNTKFPGVKYWVDIAKDEKMYKYGEDMCFILKNNRVIAETMYVSDNSSLPYDWFIETANAFLKTNYIHKSVDKNYIILYYSKFEISIRYNPYDNTSYISYEFLPKYK